MSGFMRGNAGMMAGMLEPVLNGFAPASSFSWDYSVDSRGPWADAVLWPQSGSMGNNTGWFGCGTEYPRWGPPPDEGGGQSMRKFTGITRDSAGAALGSVIVQAFTAVDDKFVGETTSDTGGYYELCSQYAGQNHYLVAYKIASPDVAGTTANTLIPS